MRRTVLLLGLAALGCHAPRTQIDEVLPEPIELTGTSFEESPDSLEMEDDALLDWWKSFEDPEVDRLVDAVLEGNLDLMQRAATLREAEARMRSAAGARWPSLDADFSASRSRTFIGGLGTFYATALTPQLTASWQTDLFGRLRSTERARASELFANDWDRTALAHSLVAQAIRSRVDLSLLARRQNLASDILDSRTNTLEIVEGRYRRGVQSVSAVDVHLARENLASARAALPPLERDRKIAEYALDVLLGELPGSEGTIDALASPLPNVDAPPVGVPLRLLDARPDLIAERFRIEAAAAELDASLAALYPDLTITANAGWGAEEFEDLFSAETFVTSVIAGLSMPIFAGGRLAADVDAARARLEANALTYAGLVLQAVREVNDALVTERRRREELVARINQRDEALAAEELARDRYSRGLESLLTVLDTERRRATAEDQVLQLQAQVWSARIDLHLALGGNWFEQQEESNR